MKYIKTENINPHLVEPSRFRIDLKFGRKMYLPAYSYRTKHYPIGRKTYKTAELAMARARAVIDRWRRLKDAEKEMVKS